MKFKGPIITLGAGLVLAGVIYTLNVDLSNDVARNNAAASQKAAPAAAPTTQAAADPPSSPPATSAPVSSAPAGDGSGNAAQKGTVTYAGSVAGGKASLAIVVNNGKAIAYVCDGKAGATRDPAPAANNSGFAKTGDIPVGGGKIFEDQKIVVTQPTAGTFKCFTAVCTHAGCVVGDVSGGTINCPCHGSKFKVADGSVANGPAKKALAAVAIAIDGDTIKKA